MGKKRRAEAVTPHHHETGVTVLTRRVRAVIERLDVAMQFSAVNGAVAHQVAHAIEFAIRGPQTRTDDDYLPGIDSDEGLALVRALIPFVEAARKRPGIEWCQEHQEPRPVIPHPEPARG